MLLRSQEKHPRMLQTLGLSFLVLGGLARLLLRPGAHLSANLVDGMTGFLYGLAIAILVLNLLTNRRQSGRP